jgi:hypothetical protein
MAIRTLSFNSAEVDGIRLGLRQGRLILETESSGRRGWRAAAELRGVDLGLNKLTAADAVQVAFETLHDGQMSGSAFLEVSIRSIGSSVTTHLRMLGTGELAGWQG